MRIRNCRKDNTKKKKQLKPCLKCCTRSPAITLFAEEGTLKKRKKKCKKPVQFSQLIIQGGREKKLFQKPVTLYMTRPDSPLDN